MLYCVIARCETDKFESMEESPRGLLSRIFSFSLAFVSQVPRPSEHDEHAVASLPIDSLIANLYAYVSGVAFFFFLTIKLLHVERTISHRWSIYLGHRETLPSSLFVNAVTVRHDSYLITKLNPSPPVALLSTVSLSRLYSTPCACYSRCFHMYLCVIV